MLTLVAALIGLIGLSRIYLGVHYPSDIVAGYLTGSVWLVTSIAVARLLALIYPRRDVASEKPATRAA
jgi:undecaprenyl-diphosphatase